MSAVRMPESSIRRETAQASRLAWAFAISLMLHLTIFGTYQAGKQLGWWQRIQWPAWMKSPKVLTELLKKQQAAPPVPQTKEPQEEAKAIPTQKPGDLILAKPDPNPTKDEGLEKRERPKTVQEAKARLQDNQLPGQKMRLEGGVSLHSRNDSL